jgi:hypothetical protein
VVHHKKRNPSCKGKIERLFEFIQRDFVIENLDLETVKEANIAFWKWVNRYNHKHRSWALQRKTPRSRYGPLDNRKSPKELEYLICHEEPRRVHRDGFISYYGNLYRVPYEYIKAPPLAGVKLKRRYPFQECGRRTIAKHKLIS